MSDSTSCNAWGSMSSLLRASALLCACVLAASVVPVRADEQAPIDVLVLAAHPDDDEIMAAGVMARAVQGGRSVRIVFMTNGDFDQGTSQGHARQDETVAAAHALGVLEQQLVFLGYPDGYLQVLDQSYPGSGDQFFSPSGQGTTYGNRGLGGADYHTYRFGSPALYNRANLLTDLEDLLSTWKPRHVFVTSEWDRHTDHATTYSLLQAALSPVIASDPSYRPTVHKTIVWSDSPGQPHLWPEPTDPTAYHVAPPSLPDTSLVWADRESIDVPLSMQSTVLGDNPKHQAIAAHGSQGGALGFLGRFLHKDEFFWVEYPAGANHPPRVEAGPGQAVLEGATVALDATGSIDADATPLTYQWVQTSGIPVTLSDPLAASPTFVAPSGLTADERLAFELTVSDGELTSVPDLVVVTVTAATPHIPPTNIAPLATVSASSENAGDGQLAVKAVDGVVDGWPGDYTREWAASGQTNGAWIELTWSRPYSIDRVIVHDRPNPEDQILSGTLTFSDGSTETIGSLDNGGAGNEFVFGARLVTSVRLTVTSTSGSTQNVGLAELLVFRTPSPDLDGDDWTVADGDCDDQSSTVEPGALDTSCNGIDENCSGVADEAYVSQGSTCGVGACGATGATSCVNGQVVDSCAPGAPGTEVCDGVDNDCNGITDDGYVPQATTCGVGACGGTGTTSCVNGQVVDSCAPGAPGTEVCDGVDNDCNGITDDGYVPQATTCGVGACGGTGTTSCVNGQVVDSCAPGAPGTEVCDGVDNDCNGITDDGYVPQATTCGVGACGGTGTTSCVNGQVVDSCAPGAPGTEVCDGVDNDCNGITDDGYVPQATTCGVGACGGTGTTSCVNGQVVDSCAPGAPGTEVCDGVDNDCNGITDDAPVPVGSPTLAIDRSTVSWSTVAGATGYDVVRGSLGRLASTGGDFSSSTEECLGNDLSGSSVPYGALPAAGQAWWYLARPVSCGGPGSFNTGAGSQVGDRDSGIQASGVACP